MCVPVRRVRGGEAGPYLYANRAEPDGLCVAWLGIQRDRPDSQSAGVNARLILMLANQIGDAAVLREAMQAARAGVIATTASGT